MRQDEIGAFVKRIVAELESRADPARAEAERKYFKGTINNLGLTLPGIRAVERELCAVPARSWAVADAVQLCDLLIARRVFEVTLLALMLAERFADRMGPAEFRVCERWLGDNLIDNWAAVDHIGPHVLGPMVASHPQLASAVASWASSTNRWLRRASAVTFILLIRRGQFLDTAYQIAEVLFEDKEDDLVQKGCGWMLREAAAVDPERLEAFLRRRGPDIPRTTLRYAIEKLPPAKKADLLAATRSRPA